MNAIVSNAYLNISTGISSVPSALLFDNFFTYRLTFSINDISSSITLPLCIWGPILRLVPSV